MFQQRQWHTKAAAAAAALQNVAVLADRWKIVAGRAQIEGE